MAAELALGVAGLAGTIDVCIKCGKGLVSACKAYRDADEKIKELTTRIELCWLTICTELEVAKDLSDSTSPEHRRVQQDVLAVLNAKLDSASRRLSRIETGMPFTLDKKARLRYARQQEGLELIIQDLEAWQGRYKPSWFLFLKQASVNAERLLKQKVVSSQDGKSQEEQRAVPEIVEVARAYCRSFREPSSKSQSAFIRESVLDRCDQDPVPHSTAVIATLRDTREMMVVDAAPQAAVSRTDAEWFARRLRETHPFTFGVFSCKGVIVRHSNAGTRFEFLFRLPPGYTSVHSLRGLLLSGKAHSSLSDRLQMAKQLVNAVYYVHLYDFVHKNIRPETILGISTSAQGDAVPSLAFLVGFQVIRKSDASTHLFSNTEWQVCLYQHPQRQGSNVQRFVMQHDIYSLGVSLLEIGLWQSFVEYDDSGTAIPSAALGLTMNQLRSQSSHQVKEHLVQLASSPQLKTNMGTMFSDVVRTCLTCLDEESVDFGAEDALRDGDDTSVGVRYITTVLETMHSISM